MGKLRGSILFIVGIGLFLAAATGPEPPEQVDRGFLVICWLLAIGCVWMGWKEMGDPTPITENPDEKDGDEDGTVVD